MQKGRDADRRPCPSRKVRDKPRTSARAFSWFIIRSTNFSLLTTHPEETRKPYILVYHCGKPGSDGAFSRKFSRCRSQAPTSWRSKVRQRWVSEQWPCRAMSLLLIWSVDGSISIHRYSRTLPRRNKVVTISNAAARIEEVQEGMQAV